MVEKNELIKQWSEKLSITEEDINKAITKIAEEEKQLHKESTQEECEARALQRIAGIYKKQLRSPAVGFEGCIIAVGDSIDTVARIKREAAVMFKTDPQIAISSGVTNDEGIALDTRKEWSTGNPNRGFGRPLPEHNWLRTIYGVALKSNVDTTPKYFIMQMSGKVATNENIPLFKPVKFRAIDKTTPENAEVQYNINSSTFTTFDIDETIKLPTTEELITKYCKPIKVSELADYHEQNKDNYSRLVAVIGDVSTIVMEPTSVGSRRVILEDSESIFDLDSQGTTCWVPERVPIDFAEGSKVIILGRTGQGRALDEQGNPTDEPGDVMINAFSLYALPKYKIELNVKEITDINTETTEEQEDKPIIEGVESNW